MFICLINVNNFITFYMIFGDVTHIFELYFMFIKNGVPSLRFASLYISPSIHACHDQDLI